uniref:Uncharacterized protein n=1 Tax=Chenopodium quinoa TaxID=63459 RepID=A0A803LDQ9_CHEQI
MMDEIVVDDGQKLVVDVGRSLSMSGLENGHDVGRRLSTNNKLATRPKQITILTLTVVTWRHHPVTSSTSHHDIIVPSSPTLPFRHDDTVPSLSTLPFRYNDTVPSSTSPSHRKRSQRHHLDPGTTINSDVVKITLWDWIYLDDGNECMESGSGDMEDSSATSQAPPIPSPPPKP